MSLYEINQSIIGQLPKYNSEQIKDLEKKIDEWNASEENQSKKFFMFLCRDIHYYTVFCLDPEQAEFRSLGEGITYLLQQAGYTVHSEEILDDHCEIWIKNDDNAGFRRNHPVCKTCSCQGRIVFSEKPFGQRG